MLPPEASVGHHLNIARFFASALMGTQLRDTTLAFVAILASTIQTQAFVYHVNHGSNIEHVMVQERNSQRYWQFSNEVWINETSHSYGYFTETLYPGEQLWIDDGYEINDNGWWGTETWWVYAVVSVSEEPIGGGGGDGGGGGGPTEEPVDPWEDVDENGVGTLGEFGLIERTNSISQTLEWVGMAVGIFVEPVDWIMTAVEIYRNPTDLSSYVGLIPGVPSGAGKIIKKTATIADIANEIVRHLPHGVFIKAGKKSSNKGLDHILRRHAPGSPAPNAGKFRQGATTKDIIDMIEDGLNKSNGVAVGPAVDGVILFEPTLDYVTGRGLNEVTNVLGGNTQKLRIVVIEATGEIITAHPLL